jgi:hypothetical protein
MKPLYLLVPAIAISPAPAQTTYLQSNIIERDRIEIVYLPNNTCYIKVPTVIQPKNHRDYVRACMNNRHLHIKIGNITSN